MQSLNHQLDKLSRASARNFLDPTELDWPAEVDSAAWYFSPQLISLYGTPAWDELDLAGRKRLSFFEAVNFFSLNIHGEKYLISEVSRRLYRDDNLSLNRYLLHFVEEEAKHMMYFSQFCQRYAQMVYPDNTLALDGGDDDDLDTFLLFARIYLFEEIVDEYNRILAADTRNAAIVREINRIHHVEEARHLAFGRKFLTDYLARHSRDWAADTRIAIKRHLESYLALVWKQYFNPAVYRDAGIADAFDVWQQAYAMPQARQHRAQINRKRLGLLQKLDLMELTT